MNCRIADMRCKEVINLCDGERLGYVCDVEVNVITGQMCSIIVPGPCRVLGLFWREADYVIPWECIKRIGDDIILIEMTGDYRRDRREGRKWFV